MSQLSSLRVSLVLKFNYDASFQQFQETTHNTKRKLQAVIDTIQLHCLLVRGSKQDLPLPSFKKIA